MSSANVTSNHGCTLHGKITLHGLHMKRKLTLHGLHTKPQNRAGVLQTTSQRPLCGAGGATRAGTFEIFLIRLGSWGHTGGSTKQSQHEPRGRGLFLILLFGAANEGWSLRCRVNLLKVTCILTHTYYNFQILYLVFW